MGDPKITLKRFDRLATDFEGEGNPNDAYDLRNIKTTGFSLKPRPGFVAAEDSPVTYPDTFASLGLGWVLSSTGTEEFLSIEDRNGTANLFKLDYDTLARTQIGTETLESGRYWVSCFYQKAYVGCPTADKTVWAHIIGDDASLYALEDHGYTPVDSPDLYINNRVPGPLYSWSSSDTLSWAGTTSYVTSPDPTADYSNPDYVLFTGPSIDSVAYGGEIVLTTTFAAAQDFSGSDYFYIPIVGQNYLKYFNPTTTKPRLKISGTWYDVTDAKFIINDLNQKDATWLCYTRGMSGLSAVDEIEITLNTKPGRGATTTAQMQILKLYPIVGGGYYLEASTSAKRIWGNTLDGNGVTYGARYHGGSGYSSIIQRTITAGEAWGYIAESQDPDSANYGPPVGGIIDLSVDAPSGIYSEVEFLRLDESVNPAEWKVLGGAAVTMAPWSFRDDYEEHAIPGLPTAATGTAPDPPPTFNTAGIVFAFPYKQSMVWLLDTGLANIQISRVGDAEEIFSVTALPSYQPDDLTIPASRTEADSQSDRPVWGVQAGPNAFIVGHHAAYALTGDAPRNTTPCQQIPGSRGIAGVYAGCRYRPPNGQYAAAYADKDLNVWVVASVPEFVGDTRAQPTELSIAVRSYMKRFLYDEQLAEFPALDIADTSVRFQESSSSLWVILGRRAMVYRHNVNGDGWEPYEFQLTVPGGESSISTCTTYTAGVGSASSVARSGSTIAWTNPSYGSIDDGNEAFSGPFSYGAKTELLRSAGIPPLSSVPASASIDSIKVKVKHRKTGDFTVTNNWVSITNNGTPIGSNLSSSTVVGSTSSTMEITTTGSLPTVADINAGKIGFELGYVSDAGNPDWNDPANWTINVTYNIPTPADFVTTQTAKAFVSVDYTGSAPLPTSVDLDCSAIATCTFFVVLNGTPAVNNGTATVGDGLGHSSGATVILGYGDGSKSHATASGSGVVTVAIDGSGHGDLELDAVGTTAGGAGSGVEMTYTASAALHVKAPSTVFVDSMQISFCYTVSYAVGSQTSGISIARADFSPRDQYLWCRSTGQIDICEQDYRTGAFVEGLNRDGGYPMPGWLWQSNRFTFEGASAGLRSVQVNTLSPSDSVQVSVKSDTSNWRYGSSSGTSLSRWWKFPPNQIGLSHSIKIEGDESAVGIDGVSIEFKLTSRRKPH